ncbi:hypothetical protein FRB90_010418 [Tulasnella sp. 427]|nr:hypothetical protein FRB90_010418 [Tulasnella sp. 427]
MRFSSVLSALLGAALLGVVTAAPIPPAKAYYTDTAPEGSERAGNPQRDGGEPHRRATHEQAVHVGNNHNGNGVDHPVAEKIEKVAREFKYSTIHEGVANSQDTACLQGDCSLTEVDESCLFDKNKDNKPCTPKGTTDTGKDPAAKGSGDHHPAANADTDTKIITPASSANKVVQVPHRRYRGHHP